VASSINREGASVLLIWCWEALTVALVRLIQKWYFPSYLNSIFSSIFSFYLSHSIYLLSCSLAFPSLLLYFFFDFYFYLNLYFYFSNPFYLGLDLLFWQVSFCSLSEWQLWEGLALYYYCDLHYLLIREAEQYPSAGSQAVLQWLLIPLWFLLALVSFLN